MLNEVVDRARKGVSAKDRDERAQAAVRAFRQMQFGLSSYARAITGNPHVRVEVDGGIPRTDGTVIYYRPPIELGDKTPHDRYYCDNRDDYGLQVCPACRVREEVLVNIYHEIAHIAFSTFADTTDSDRRKALDAAIREWGGDFEKRIRERFEKAPLNVRMSYMGLANLVSPYLPFLFNSLEDARVDSAMFKARKGTRKMLEADTLNLLREGVPNAQGEMQRLADSPLNSQAALGCYLYVTGYKGWRDLVNEKVVTDLADPELIGYLDEIKTADNVSDVFGITFPVLARLRELGYLKTPEEEQDEEQQEESDDSSDDGPESEANPEGSDSDDSTGGDGAPAEDGAADGAAATPSRGGEEEADGGGADPEAAGEEAEQVPPVEDGHGGEAGSEAGSDGSTEGAGPDPDGAGEGEDAGGGDQPSSESDHDGPVPDGGGQLPSEDEGGDQGVPEQPEEGLGDASDSSEPAPEGAGGSADSSDSDGSGGGDQESGDGLDGGATDPEEVDAGDGGSSDDVTGESEQDSGAELDGDRGDEGAESSQPHRDQPAVQESSGAEAQADSSAGEGGAPEDSPKSDSVRDEGGADGPSGEADRPDGPVDSGADQGFGGIKTETLPESGTVEDVEAALDHGHETRSHDDNNPEAVADVKAILTAIVQGMYFETPSVGVKQVQEHYFGPFSYGWVSPYGERYAKAFGVEADTDVPESILGPALLKTRRIFSDNKKAQHTSNLRSGRVNQRVLGKRAFSGDDRLFKKKRQPAKKSYAVLIGMDISSSNKGDNMARLKRAVMAQAELCQRVGVEFAIVAHSCAAGEGGFAMHIHHVKDWNQPWDDKAKAALDGLVPIGGNLDGHALEFMRKGIMYHTATEKIIMYYTDGKMPAANHNEELEVLIQQIKHCKRDNITLMGVGMQTDSPVRHGLDTVQVDSDEDLKSVVEHLGKRLAVRAR